MLVLKDLLKSSVIFDHNFTVGYNTVWEVDKIEVSVILIIVWIIVRVLEERVTLANGQLHLLSQNHQYLPIYSLGLKIQYLQSYRKQFCLYACPQQIWLWMNNCVKPRRRGRARVHEVSGEGCSLRVDSRFTDLDTHWRGFRGVWLKCVSCPLLSPFQKSALHSCFAKGN